MAWAHLCAVGDSVSKVALLLSVWAPTEGGAGLRSGHRGHDDKAEAFVFAAADLYVIGLQSGRDTRSGVEGLRGGGGSRCRNHGVGASSYASASSSTSDARGGATARADSVKGILAALQCALPDFLRQTGRLGAAVVGGCWRWRNVTLCFN